MQSSTFQEFDFSSLINFTVKDFNIIFAEIIFLLEIKRERISGAALLETRQNVSSVDRL